MSDIFSNLKVQNAGTPAVSQSSPTNQKPIMVKDAIAAAKTRENVDSLEISNKPKEKFSLLKSFKRGVANFKKFFATVGSYANGIYKGAVYGTGTGLAVFGAGTLVNTIRNHKAAANEKVKLIHSKPLAIAAGICVLAGNIWKASLNATDARSDIHDRYIGTEKK